MRQMELEERLAAEHREREAARGAVITIDLSKPLRVLRPRFRAAARVAGRGSPQAGRFTRPLEARGVVLGDAPSPDNDRAVR